MGRRNKLEKFSQILSWDNVFECYDPTNPELIWKEGSTIDMVGKWDEIYFKNGQPLTLELACGKGDYTIGLAEMYPDHNFIGVDVKGNRIWRGALTAREREYSNVAFLRTRIERLDHFFDKKEVDEIWITFPHPFPNKENRRLTCPKFLNMFKGMLKDGGKINFKTDDTDLFDYTLEVLADLKVHVEYQSHNIYAAPLENAALEIKTFYEKQHLSNKRTIKYVRFHF